MDLNPARRLSLALLGLLTLLAGCVAPTGPRVTVEEPWARPAKVMGSLQDAESMAENMSQPEAGTGAVYMRLVNGGGEPDRLLGAATDVAAVVEIHETVLDGEVAKMQMLPEGLLLPARSKVELKPGGYHIMLMGVSRDLVPGDRFTLDLSLQESGNLPVEVEVREP